MIDIEEIKKILPHGHGFLLVDRVIDFEPEKHITVIKNITYNEPCFASHFPKVSVFPGVLTVEAGLQAAAIMWYKSFFEKDYPLTDDNFTPVVFVSKIEKVCFRQPVVPGDTLTIRIEHRKHRQNFYFADAFFSVDGKQKPEVATSTFSGYFNINQI